MSSSFSVHSPPNLSNSICGLIRSAAASDAAAGASSWEDALAYLTACGDGLAQMGRAATATAATDAGANGGAAGAAAALRRRPGSSTSTAAGVAVGVGGGRGGRNNNGRGRFLDNPVPSLSSDGAGDDESGGGASLTGGILSLDSGFLLGAGDSFADEVASASTATLASLAEGDDDDDEEGSSAAAAAAAAAAAHPRQHHRSSRQPAPQGDATRALAKVAQRAGEIAEAQRRINSDSAAAGELGGCPVPPAAIDGFGSFPFILARVEGASSSSAASSSSSRLVVRGKHGATPEAQFAALRAEVAAASAAAAAAAASQQQQQQNGGGGSTKQQLPPWQRLPPTPPKVTLVGTGVCEWARGHERHVRVTGTGFVASTGPLASAGGGAAALPAVAQAAAAVLRSALPLTHKVSAAY